MNYAFKMMAVVLALGVLVLQGCQTTSNYSQSNNYVYNDVTTWSFSHNEIICSKARIYKNGKKYWDTNAQTK